MKFDIC